MCLGSGEVVVCWTTHPGFESDEFKNHFHSEDSSEDHIENVHYIVKERRLAVVLQRRQEQLRKSELLLFLYAIN